LGKTSYALLALVTIPLSFMLGYLLSPDFWHHQLNHLRTGTDCCGFSLINYIRSWAAGVNEFENTGGLLFSLAIPATVWVGINGVYVWIRKGLPKV
jgi:hypothetical protein